MYLHTESQNQNTLVTNVDVPSKRHFAMCNYKSCICVITVNERDLCKLHCTSNGHLVHSSELRLTLCKTGALLTTILITVPICYDTTNRGKVLTYSGGVRVQETKKLG
jgi:hypothetical protein